ncbi:MAG: class E sortase [Candidatus Veblenbacteria bacterium]|nr:class E sortase [Candidatus Veblenbacteria bacterium]
MPTWMKPALFGLGLAAAGLIATNPSFVLPWKYWAAEQSMRRTQAATELGEVTQLPDGYVEAVEVGEEGITGGAPAASEATAQALTAAKSSAPRAWVGGSLAISSLKIEVPLLYVNQRSEKAFQLGLQQGVVQYPGTALPGQLGNMYVFGHSSDYRWAKGNYKTVFAKLPNIKKGAEVVVTDGAGKKYTYRVTSTAVALPSEVKYLSQYDYQRRILTVQTSYPVGTALKRFLAVAELVEE